MALSHGASRGRPEGTSALRTAQLLLALFVGLILFDGGRDRAWPMIAWGMYRTIRPPAEVVSAFELRATDMRGDSYSCTPSQLFTRVELTLARTLIRNAFDDTDPLDQRASRRFLAGRLSELWPNSKLVEIQGFKLSWKPALTVIPPLDRDRPATRTLLGKFRVRDHAGD